MTPRNKFVKMKRAADGDYPSDVAGLVNYFDTNSNRQMRLAEERRRAADEEEEVKEEYNEEEQEKKAFFKIRKNREKEAERKGRENNGEDVIRNTLVGIGDSLFALIGLGGGDDEKPKHNKSIDEKTK